jgi:hypothetical protein
LNSSREPRNRLFWEIFCQNWIVFVSKKVTSLFKL